MCDTLAANGVAASHARLRRWKRQPRLDLFPPPRGLRASPPLRFLQQPVLGSNVSCCCCLTLLSDFLSSLFFLFSFFKARRRSVLGEREYKFKYCKYGADCFFSSSLGWKLFKMVQMAFEWNESQAKMRRSKAMRLRVRRSGRPAEPGGKIYCDDLTFCLCCVSHRRGSVKRHNESTARRDVLNATEQTN